MAEKDRGRQLGGAEIPSELGRYISRMQIYACEANAADFKPTMTAELKRIKEECVRLYKVGSDYMAKISAADLERCQRLYMARGRNISEMNDLNRTIIERQFMIVPNYVGLIIEVRELKKVLA